METKTALNQEKPTDANNVLEGLIGHELSKLSNDARNKLFAIWMTKERLEGTKTLSLMLALDDEWQRIYDLNRKNGFTAASLFANQHLLGLIYGR
jgi:hypothetical protein